MLNARDLSQTQIRSVFSTSEEDLLERLILVASIAEVLQDAADAAHRAEGDLRRREAFALAHRARQTGIEADLPAWLRESL
ncbi:MAG: hypothetical protein GY716_15780 [bacterium]|nr:hypothetical protein [bacterium]